MLQELLGEQDRYYDAVLRDKYAKGDERTADDVYRRVARGLAAVEPEPERARREAQFLEALRGGFTPAGRIMSAAGTDIQATLINCFVQPVGDSIAEVRDGRVGIYTALLQAAETMRRGGGVGYDFSAIRPRGARVAGTRSRASGPISYMRVFDRSCETVESAGARRGAQMGVLRVDHPDILEFIAAKDVRVAARRLRAAGLAGRELDEQLAAARTLANFNLSVAVTDEFMRLKAEGGALELVHAAEPDRDEHPQARQRADGLWVYRTVPAAELWDRILQTTYETADPGVVFIDRMNGENNLAYAERLDATNPCVTVDTWVHTLDGPRQVNDLIGRRFVAIVNGEMHASSPEGFFATGHKPVLELTTCEGHRVTLTEDHPVMTVSKLTRWRCEKVWRKAGDLQPGDEIVLNDHRAAPRWEGFGTREQGYLLGLMIGDGFLSENGAHLAVWPSALTADGSAADGVAGVMAEADRCLEMLRHRADFRGWMPVRGHQQFRVRSASLRDLAIDLGMSPGHKAVTPRMESASSGFSRGLLRGLFDTDGSVQGSQLKGVSVRLTQVDIRTLEAAQRMLLRLGIDSTIYRARKKSGEKLMPDGRGGSALYPTQAVHELIVSGDNLQPFAEHVGFADSAKALRLETLLANYRRKLNRTRFLARVKEVVPAGTQDVFDVSIPGINAFDANGLVVHNCGEQPLPSYGCCCLGSLNLARLVLEPFTENARLDYAQLRELAATAVRMLDDVLDATYWPLPEQQREAQAKRRLGLGFAGLGTALMMLRIRYGSEEGIATAAQIARELRDAAYRASVELAKERGAFPLLDKEKYLAAPFIQRLPQDIRDGIRTHGIRNSHLLSIAPTGTISLAFGRNVTGGIEPAFAWEYTRKTRDKAGKSIEYPIQDFGYRRYLEMGGDKAQLPAYFASAQTLAPADHLRVQAAVQPFVDSSISKTINCPVDLPFDDFKRVYDLAYESGCKGCTTYRPNDVTGAVLSVPAESAAHPTLALEPPALDRRLKLDKLPAPPLASLKWPGRPEFARGNPAWTYLIDAGPGCRFAVFVGHIENGESYPFEVWVNGAEQPRGLGATAKLLSMDMRSRDRGWLKLKLESLIRTRGNPIPVAMPPSGETVTMASPTAALARLVQLRCQDLGAFESSGGTPVLDALLSAEEPVTGTDGTMSWTVDVKNPATGDDAVLVLKELQMPDGQRRPYAMALVGDYPRDLDGLCRLLSLDMRVVDPAWIGAKLAKLQSFPETGGSFLGRVPGAERAQLYPSTVAYLAALALHRYRMLGILDESGAPLTPLGVLEAPAATAHARPLLGAPCPDCGAHAVVRHEGCQSCTSCGWIGNCG
jgi:ribonucleoside-diphosphate reductase alpha chain